MNRIALVWIMMCWLGAACFPSAARTAPGDDCSEPITIVIPAALPFQDLRQTTCGMGDDYTETCLDAYDEGEDIVYELLVTEKIRLDIGVSTAGPYYIGSIGAALHTECPPGDPCFACATAEELEFGVAFAGVVLAPGSYYLMVDTDGTPSCLEAFTTTIEACPARPANDRCVDAQLIYSPHCASVCGTTKGAMVDCPGSLDCEAVWYRFEVTGSVNTISVDFSETAQDIHYFNALLYEEPANPLAACPSACADYLHHESLAWIDCPNGYRNPVVTWSAPGPQTLYLLVHARQPCRLGVDFAFTIVAEPIDTTLLNDDCSSAVETVEVEGLAFCTDYTSFDGAGTCMNASNIWFCFNSMYTGQIEIEAAVDFSAMLALYEGCACEPLGERLACVHFYSHELVTFDAVAGTSYLIEIGGLDANGRGSLDIRRVPVPIGACCVDEVCVANATEAACLARNGTWYRYESCPEFHCPNLHGDTCEDPVILAVPADLPHSGYNDRWYTHNDYRDTCLLRYDDDDPDVIYQLEVIEETALTIQWDGVDSGEIYRYGLAVDTNCPPDYSCLFSDAGGFCIDHFEIPRITFSPGVYYVLLKLNWLWYPHDDYDLTIFQLPLPAPGDDCTQPLPVTIPGDLPFLDSDQSTCGRYNDYYETWLTGSCLTNFDGGEDMFYELTVDEITTVDITMDPKGTYGTGVAVIDACQQGAGCLAYEKKAGSEIYGIQSLLLMPGTYYCVIDCKPTTNCIQHFDLTINASTTGACCVAGTCSATTTEINCLDAGGDWFEGFTCPGFPCPQTGGIDCDDPTQVYCPAGLPFIDDSATTCGRIDDYDASCLLQFDEGEDLVYELFITEDTCVDIGVVMTDSMLDHTVGVALDSVCPPGIPCIAFDRADYNEYGAALPGQQLAPGTYYMMVDSTASAGCMHDLTISIEPCPQPPVNDACSDAVMIQAAFPVELTGTTKGATPDCPEMLDNEVWYRFTADFHWNLVTMDFCGTETMLFQVGTVLFEAPEEPAAACPDDCTDWIDEDDIEWRICPGGLVNPTITWMLPGPAEYYLPVSAENASGLGVDFMFVLDSQDMTEPNDDCPQAMSIGEVTDLPFDTTCSSHDAPGACMTGPNLWYRFTAPHSSWAKAVMSTNGFAPKMAVYRGGSCSPLGFELDCCGMLRGMPLAECYFPAVKDHPYLIEIGSDGSTGAGTLTVQCLEPIPVLDAAACIATLVGVGLLLVLSLKKSH
ncbi:hypothetical protein JW905_05905 [bacterium]|nr:hypothetical protein [candidate division CSSED10-310 bacterium]